MQAVPVIDARIALAGSPGPGPRLAEGVADDAFAAVLEAPLQDCTPPSDGALPAVAVPYPAAAVVWAAGVAPFPQPVAPPPPDAGDPRSEDPSSAALERAAPDPSPGGLPAAGLPTALFAASHAQDGAALPAALSPTLPAKGDPTFAPARLAAWAMTGAGDVAAAGAAAPVDAGPGAVQPERSVVTGAPSLPVAVAAMPGGPDPKPLRPLLPESPLPETGGRQAVPGDAPDVTPRVAMTAVLGPPPRAPLADGRDDPARPLAIPASPPDAMTVAFGQHAPARITLIPPVPVSLQPAMTMGPDEAVKTPLHDLLPEVGPRGPGACPLPGADGGGDLATPPAALPPARDLPGAGGAGPFPAVRPVLSLSEVRLLSALAALADRPAPDRAGADGPIPTGPRHGLPSAAWPMPVPAQPVPALPAAGPPAPDALADHPDDVEPPLADDGLPLSPGPATPAAPASGAGVTVTAAPVPRLAEAMATLVAGKGEGSTEIALAPEELGKVRLQLQTDAQNPDRLVVVMTFDRPETLDLFRRHASDLAEALRSAGYGDTRLDFGQSGTGSGNGAGSAGPALRDEAEPVTVPGQSAALTETPTPPDWRTAPGSLDIRL